MDPRKGFEKGMQDSADAAKGAFHAMSDLAALALMPDDSFTRLKGTPGHHKWVAWCPPISLAEVKAVGKVHISAYRGRRFSLIVDAVSA